MILKGIKSLFTLAGICCQAMTSFLAFCARFKSCDCSYSAQCKREGKVDKICAAQCKRKSTRTSFMRIKFNWHGVPGYECMFLFCMITVLSYENTEITSHIIYP